MTYSYNYYLCLGKADIYNINDLLERNTMKCLKPEGIFLVIRTIFSVCSLTVNQIPIDYYNYYFANLTSICEYMYNLRESWRQVI